MNVERILLRGVNWIGDAIIATPAIRAIRRAWPSARVDMMCRPWVAPIYASNPDIDHVIEIDERGARGAYLAALWRARAERYDLGVAFPNSFGSALCLWLAGARRRAGYARDGRRWLLTDASEATRAIRRVHEVEYYLNALRRWIDVDAAERDLVLQADDPSRRSLEAKMGALGIDGARTLVGINPGAAYGSAKRWLPERYAAVAERLARERGATVLITGGPGEGAIARAIEERANAPLVNLAERLTLRELIALAERLRLYVTNDSGAMHVAAAMGVAIVAV